MPKARTHNHGSAASSEPVDLNVYDYHMPHVRHRVRRRRKEWKPVITDDWPERIPVTVAELDVFEAYFGTLLDELFEGR